MQRARRHALVVIASWLACCAATGAIAAEPNNTPFMATILPGGQLTISDSLDGAPGRPNTLLGIFDPSFNSLLYFNDNDSPLGNGFASQLTGVPLRSDGSLYFKITGATDGTFAGNHTESGQYAWYLDVRDPQGNLVPSLSRWQNDELSPFAQDTEWLDPATSPDPANPNWVGYTADITLNNVIGPGSGDALDYWLFSGFEPFQSFEATIDGEFPWLLTHLDASNVRLSTTSAMNGNPILSGTADFLGRVKIGVSGVGDSNFTGAHVQAGDYTLTLSVVPEPGSVILVGLGAAGIWIWVRTNHGRRRKHTSC